MKRLLLVVLFCSLPAFGANRFVTPSGAGTQSGVDWSNAMAASFTPMRGDNYYLADGSYGSKNFDTVTSGTTVISVKKCTTTDGVSSGAAGYVSTLCDGQATFANGIGFNTSYWTFDGVTGGGPSDWACASCGFSIPMTTAANCNDHGGILNLADGITAITVKHAVGYGTQQNADGADWPLAIMDANSGSAGTTGLHISYSYFHHTFGGGIFTQNMDNATFEYSHFSYLRSTGTTDPFGHCNDAHGELFSNIGGDDNGIFRHNLVDKIQGTAVFAGINGGTRNGWQIYGNIFHRVGTFIIYDESGGQDNIEFYNNTLTFGQASMPLLCSNGCTGYVRNNIFYNNAYNSGYLSFTHNWNYASENYHPDIFVTRDDQVVDGEANGVDASGSPFVDVTNADPLTLNFHLTAATSAGCSAVGTCSFTPDSTDMYGVTRGSDGTWDRGAIEYGVGGGDPKPVVGIAGTVSPR
jgi:hypothetical protein